MEQECIVYLETFEKIGDGVSDAYVDFRQEKDSRLFTEVTGIKIETATMIELRSLKSAKLLRNGCYYMLNLELLNGYQAKPVEDSFLVGAVYDLADMPVPEDDNHEMLQRHGPLDAEELSMASIPQGKIFDELQSGYLKLYVKDVGQANWNELRNGDSVKVLYDAGAEVGAKKSVVSAVFDSREAALEKSKPILVISHWDLDHIHCLTSLNSNAIRNCFSKIICPDRLKSQTSMRVLSNFRNALGEAYVYCLPLPHRTNGVKMHLWQTEDGISIYLGEKSRSINYCGLVMFVRGGRRTANYTGDCRLAQAKNAYDQERVKGIDTAEHILVAPHHGGDCGVEYRHYSRPCNVICISVGQNNRYGHPHDAMVRYLGALGHVKQTKNMGDILEDL